MVQWLRLPVLPLQGAQVRSLVGELGSHTLCGLAKKKKKKIKILNKKELKKKEILTPKDDSAGGVCFKRFLNPSRMGLQPHKRGFVEVSQPLLPCENRRSLKSGRGLSPNNANTITLDL